MHSCRLPYQNIFKIGEIKMIGFIIGLFVGAFIGVLVMCLCNVASKADKNMETHFNNNNGEDNTND